MSGVIKINIYLIVIVVEIIRLWLTGFVSAKLSYSIFISNKLINNETI